MKKYYLLSILLTAFFFSCDGLKVDESTVKGAPTYKKGADEGGGGSGRPTIPVVTDSSDIAKSRTPSDEINHFTVAKGKVTGAEVKVAEFLIPVGGEYKVEIVSENKSVRIKPLFPLDEYKNRLMWEGFARQDTYQFEVYLDADAAMAKESAVYELQLTKVHKPTPAK